MGLDAALNAGDALVKELAGGAMTKTPSPAPTMGNLKKVSYTHAAMIDLIIANPNLDQNQIAAHFGYTPSWISNILASDAFQSQMAARREEIVDPELKASIEERFRALIIQSIKVLQDKLSKPTVSDQVALRAAELGAKALGLGGHAVKPAEPPAVDRLERLAGRLVELNRNAQERVINAEVTVVQVEKQL